MGTLYVCKCLHLPSAQVRLHPIPPAIRTTRIAMAKAMKVGVAMRHQKRQNFQRELGMASCPMVSRMATEVACGEHRLILVELCRLASWWGVRTPRLAAKV